MMMLRPRHLACACFAAALALVPLAAASARADEELSARRADQRERIRAASQRADKSGGGAAFGLLVIPVDFADARFPAGFSAGRDLAPRLAGDGGETLRNYFAVASGGRCDLRVTLAPTIHMSGNRTDYLEGFAGAPHTRSLAATALTDVAATGFPFRELDMDGPDGLAGTPDDDGRVDGVLLLHAGPGTEDGGIVPAHQFYLEEPIVQDGVAADTYAAAGYRSGLGIWAHETLHLLGLEERYDPLLPSDAGDSEIHSRGGLGIFSVMAAGAWGTGGGHGCALPDGYSAWQLGWVDAVDLPAGAAMDTVRPAVSSRRVARTWTHGEPGDEFFLAEVRDPAAAAPFDAAVPRGDLVIYHVDEAVPDGWRAVTIDGYHLRARLVEADADDALRDGLDEGSAADLFPGTLGVRNWTPLTTPNSSGYGGPSQVSLLGITALDDGVAFATSVSEDPAIHVDLAFVEDGSWRLDLEVRSVGRDLWVPTAELTALAPALGAFAEGGTTVSFGLDPVGGAGLHVPSRTITWLPDPDLPAGATTTFRLQVGTFDWFFPPFTIVWPWDDAGDVLDFDDFGPGGWEVEEPFGSSGATWHLWTGNDNPVADGRSLIACTDPDETDASTWPDVAYGFGAYTRLTSPPLGPGTTAVRLIHAWDTEVLPDGRGMDGGTVVWVDQDGDEHPAAPVDGWPGHVAAESTARLHGSDAFVGALDLDDQSRPVWRSDVFPVPDEGAGAWRLRLVFASNARNGDGLRRGWFLAEATALTAPVPASGWPVAWTDTSLTWSDPPGGGGDEAEVVRRSTDGLEVVGAGGLVPRTDPEGYTLTASQLRPHLPGPARTLHRLGLIRSASYGALLSRPVLVMLDGGAAETPFVGAPWPNPSATGVSFTLDVPDGANARWRIYDVRGRLLRDEVRAVGTHLVKWDGRDREGRRVPAGVYLVEVTGATVERTHKVVLLR